jgi:hypothetical protein
VPRHGVVSGRLTGALCLAALASLLLSSLSGVAEASGAASRPENPTEVRGTGPRSFVAPSPSATLEAAYRAARAERSFELLYEVPLALFGSSPSKPVFWVLQTEQSSRAVEEYQLTLKGKLVTTYVLFSAQQTCTWFAPGQAPPGSAKSASVPSCSSFNSSGYNSEIFSFLSLTGAHLTGPGQVVGTAVIGVGGNLVQSIDNNGSHTSMSWGPVTFWVATKTSLPVAVTASADGRRVVIFKYADWDSPTVRFPTGTPS